MPRESVPDEKRRRVVLAALRPGANKAAIAREEGVSREWVSRETSRARRRAAEEAAFWREVEGLTSPTKFPEE